MKRADGSLVPLDTARLDALIAEACVGLDGVSGRADPRRNAPQSL